MTLYRATLPPAERRKAEAEDAKRAHRIIKVTQAARTVTAALHDYISRNDPHSKGMAAALAHLTDTVTAIIEARQLPPVAISAPERKRAR